MDQVGIVVRDAQEPHHPAFRVVLPSTCDLAQQGYTVSIAVPLDACDNRAQIEEPCVLETALINKEDEVDKNEEYGYDCGTKSFTTTQDVLDELAYLATTTSTSQ